MQFLGISSKKNKTKGFTLVEMLVVTGIIALLSVLAIAGFRAGQKRYVLTTARQGFVGALRQAQSMATSGAEIPGYLTAGGFGVHVIDSQRYVVFFNPNTTSKNYDASSVALNTVTLPERVAFSSGVGYTAFYVPPIPTTYLNGGLDISTLYFTLTRAGVNAGIDVRAFGRIDY